MNKQEIIEKLKELLNQPAMEVYKEVRALEKEYKKIWTEEFEKAKQAFIDEGGKAKDFVYVKSNEDEVVAELILRLEKKKEAEEEKLKHLQEENKRKKEELISQMEALANAEVNDITPIIKKLREIQNQWKEIKELKKSDYAELQRKYNTLLDKINENIKAFSTLQEYDAQKNTELKEELLAKMEHLLSLDDPKKINNLFESYRREWNKIGNVISEKYAEIKTRYNEINQKIKQKLDTFYQALEEEKNKNFERKKQLINELKSITDKLSAQENIFWKDLNEKIQNLKNEWISIGHIPSEYVKEINEEYNRLLDIYYDAKRKHIEYIQKKQEEIKAAKEKILQELEKLKDSQDFDQNTKKIIQLQQEWKKHYLTNKEENEKLNQLFKQYCDTFFENKRNYDKQKIQEEKDNLVKKLEIIQKLKNTTFDKSNPETVLQQIQEFIKEWNAVGHVPIEEKDKVNDDFYSIINQLYADLQLSDEKRHSIQYKSKIQQLIQSSPNPIETLNKEEKFIKKKISELKNELLQIDNNLAFFKNAKSDNPLLKEAHQKKEKISSYINEWESKLNIIRGFLGELKKSQPSES
ncbi:MAG: hypothetical protein Fur0023_07950 [Bacteroidia bacterium]